MTGVPIVSPKQQFSFNGEPLVNGTVHTLVAGTSTPAATWQDKALTIANTNPIILNSQGECDIWLEEGKSYKLVLKDSLGTTIWTTDNVIGAVSSVAAASEWVDTGLTPTYSAPTVFTLTGNQTAAYHAGRRVRATVSGGFRYGTIATSVFSTVTTVTLVLDSNTLDASLSTVDLGFNSAVNGSAPIIVSGSAVPVTVSGAVTLPARGDYFVLTGTGFNITGFASSIISRIVTLRLPDGLTLVNSASLILHGGFNRVTALGDTITLVCESGGVWRELNYNYAFGLPGYKVHRNGTNTGTITAGTTVPLTLNFNAYNPQNLFVTDTATIKTPGLYRAEFAMKLATNTSITDIQIDIAVNSTQEIFGQPHNSVAGSPNGVCHCSGLLLLNAGDIVVNRMTLTGTSYVVSGARSATYATLTKVE